jgi:hypothetical protein
MHPNTVFPEPIFIPKFIHIDTQFPERFPGRRSFLIPGNFFTDPRYQRLCTSAVDNCELCIIDPVTNAFTYDGFLDKPTYRGLPYSQGRILTALDFRAQEEFTRRFVQDVIEFQLQNGAGLVIAPYLFARDIDDGRFLVNLDLLSAALRYTEQQGLEQPLFAMLNIGSSFLDSPRIINMITEQYADFDVQGFFVCVENFDDRVVGYEQLLGMVQLCRSLSAEKDLIVSTIASFGQVLCSLGINGFVGGVGWLETFREINLRSGREAFGAQQIPRARYYYVPELLSYLRPDDTETIFNPEECRSMTQYRCRCEICEEQIPEEPLSKKTHFLIRRFQEMEEIAREESPNRAEHIRGRLELALALAEDIENEALIRIPTEHLVRWLNVLDAQPLPDDQIPEEGEDLDELIHEIRQDE